ncbi:elongation factor EF-2 [Candidatus Woesearchaeota archaeon]|nr:elongation factor EF-2 [Candidatus Woesearchaeota archaeon]
MAAKDLEAIKKLMRQPEFIRNIDIAAHIDHGKTTLSDNLLAGAGMLSEQLAGKALQLDFHEDEQARGITIDAAAVSMIHEYEGNPYLINLIDTPGHVDFGGDVTRAMRAVDGCIVVVCAVEGIMPQTETVLKQALRELVKPVLFINKVDRLIKELQLSPEKMQERFANIIKSVNQFIRENAPEGYGEKWQVNVQDGSVCFGSAFHNWALSLPFMKKTGLTFKDIIQAYETDDWKQLKKKAPLHEVLLNMVIEHLPNPVEAQKYRIPKIWHGDLQSPEGQALLNCDPNGKAAFIITKVVVDPQAGELCIGRLFSGTLRKGQTIWLNRAKQQQRIQQLYVAKGAKRELVDEVVAGNIVGIAGLKNAYPGETISSEPMEPFEQIKHIFEPVITKAIEAKNPADLPKLVEVLMQVTKEDPNIVVQINQETGEHLMSGMGELHLEIVENRIRTVKGVDVQTSPPIVVYRETITKKTPQAVEGKSPNKHNKFYIRVEPLPESIYKLLRSGEIPDMRIKKNMPDVWEKLEKAGMDKQETRRVKDIFKGNIFIDATRGVVHIGEVIEMVLDMFEEVMNAGPIAREPCIKVKVILEDVKLHEDAIHRGPSQVYPAVRTAIRQAFMQSGPLLLEPVQTLLFEAPLEHMGDIIKIVSSKRGQLLEMNQTEKHVEIKAKLPVAEMFGLSSELRSATGGRGTFFLIDQEFERLPDELQQKVIKQIRERKGLKLEEEQ